MALALDQRPVISEGDRDCVTIDFTDYLDDGESLTGIPVVAEVTTSDLTLANKTVTTGILTVLGRGVAAGKAVQFTVLGQMEGVTYRVRVTVSTDSSPARVKVVDAILTCAAAADT